MKSKNNSEKITPVQILFWMLLSVSVIAVSSCSHKKLTKSPVSQVKSEQTEDKVYMEVEQLPEYPGGNAELNKYIVMNLKYPADAIKTKTQGKVFVSFVIGKEGIVRDAKVVRGVDPLLDAEALRVVKSLPKFTPGKDKGKIVSVAFTLPINFALH